jgi:hypothetical protein
MFINTNNFEISVYTQIEIKHILLSLMSYPFVVNNNKMCLKLVWARVRENTTRDSSVPELFTRLIISWLDKTLKTIRYV